MIHKSEMGSLELTRTVLTRESQHISYLHDNGHDSISICNLSCWVLPSAAFTILLRLECIHIKLMAPKTPISSPTFYSSHKNTLETTLFVCWWLQRRAVLESLSRAHGKLTFGFVVLVSLSGACNTWTPQSYFYSPSTYFCILATL